MNKKVVERFKIGGSAGHPSMPSAVLQRAIGTEILVDIESQKLIVPTEKGNIEAVKGDTIICFSDGTFEVEKGA